MRPSMAEIAKKNPKATGGMEPAPNDNKGWFFVSTAPAMVVAMREGRPVAGSCLEISDSWDASRNLTGLHRLIASIKSESSEATHDRSVRLKKDDEVCFVERMTGTSMSSGGRAFLFPRGAAAQVEIISPLVLNTVVWAWLTIKREKLRPLVPSSLLFEGRPSS